MKCGSTKCRNYDGTCDGGRILVMECNVTITSHKKKRLRNWGLAGKIQWHTKIPLRVNTNRINFLVLSPSSASKKMSLISLRSGEL